MSWLTEILFPRRTALAARAEVYAARCRQLESERDAAIGNQRRALEQLNQEREITATLRAVLDSRPARPRPEPGTARLERALRAVARHRQDTATAERRAARLQARLDDALGLNSPGVQAGKHWQESREDVRHGVKR